MTLTLHEHILSSCIGYVFNETCILGIFLIVSVKLTGIMWSEDDIERSFCLFCVILHPVDLLPNSGTKGHFQHLHPPQSVLLHI